MELQKNQNCVDLADLLRLTEKLNHIKDLDSMLDTILLEARSFCGAEAGSIFLRSGNELTFSYTQNDMLSKFDRTFNRNIYSNHTMPIDRSSIAGYVADTGSSLVIDDVYKLTSDVPYHFNSHFDELSAYRTHSILAIPLVTSAGNITGVMQIINAKDQSDIVTTFSELHNQYVTFLSNNASVAVERAQMTREIILRMIQMAELRDPKETGSHVNRVGSYSIEIYHQWANNRGIDEDGVRKTKDLLRIASMLHDVGKVAISDTILKKPALLDEHEQRVMQTHCRQGADLFAGKVSPLDLMCLEIALYHHEKFDGTGYPEKLKGEQIPLAARIVALADVFDALISRRVYKKEWPEDKVLALIKDQSGVHFDPEVVKAFFEVYEVITAVRSRYPDIDE